MLTIKLGSILFGCLHDLHAYYQADNKVLTRLKKKTVKRIVSLNRPFKALKEYLI